MTSSLGSLSTPSKQVTFSIVEASSIGRIAYFRLKKGEEGTIHEMFDTAINILFPRGLVSLVPEAVQRGPLNVTLRLPAGPPRMSSFGVRAGDKVNLKGFTLELGDRHLISFSSAQIYSPKHKFTQQMLADNEIEANLEVMRKTTLLFGNMAGLGELLTLLTPIGAEPTSKNLNIFASAAFGRITRFEQAFRSHQKTELTAAIRDLIGLGPGLTPSSDDMLAGLVLLYVLYTTNCGCKKGPSRLLSQVIAEQVAGRTTIISEEFLRQAALGNGNEPVMRLCEALLTGGQDLVEQETKRVLSIGETSGTDTVLGILLGTMFSIGKQSRLEMRKPT